MWIAGDRGGAKTWLGDRVTIALAVPASRIEAKPTTELGHPATHGLRPMQAGA